MARCIVYSVLGLTLGLFCARTSAAPLTATEIMQKAVDRAQTNQVHSPYHDYLYQKVSVTETFDSKGKVKDRKEKLFLIQSGKVYLLEMKLNGKTTSAVDLKKEEAAARQARQEVTEQKSTHRDENWERFMTGDLIKKYEFTLEGTETINGREAYVVKFRPQNDDLPVRAMVDRIFNRMAGTVWIDIAEFEVAKAKMSLQSAASFGGLLKVIGAINRLDYLVERVRLDDHVWFNRATEGDYETRKLWDCSHVRTKTEAQGFQRNQSAKK